MLACSGTGVAHGLMLKFEVTPFCCIVIHVLQLLLFLDVGLFISRQSQLCSLARSLRRSSAYAQLNDDLFSHEADISPKMSSLSLLRLRCVAPLCAALTLRVQNAESPSQGSADVDLSVTSQCHFFVVSALATDVGGCLCVQLTSDIAQKSSE